MSAIVTYELGTVDTLGEMTGVQFGLMTADEVRRMSVVEIRETTLYTRGAPTPRGVLDHRMGTVDRRLPCGTCKRDLETCPGHWGHIELPMPVMHTAFVETARKLLNCVCYACSRLRISDEDRDNLPAVPTKATHRKQRLSAIYGTCRSRKVCPHCTTPCPIISRSPVGAAFEIVAEWGHLDASTAFASDEERDALIGRELTPELAHDILSGITNEDVVALGLDPSRTHPGSMILTVLLVPPPIIRPSVMVSEGSRARGQDDLTIRLVEITKRAAQLRAAMAGGTPADVREAWSRMGQEVAVYMHNNPRGTRVATQRSGTLTKCLLGRLKGKRGRFRSNLMGKRVNFSGRSVISPDPTLDVEEVGIPITMAMQLTVQERVTRSNHAELTSRVMRGAGHVDGAQAVIATDGTAIQLEFCTQRDMLALGEGWIVERPLQTGDWILFNRQPSLHRNSLMGHRVRVMPGKTLRCNLAVVGPYNADFDGDEMNVHVPQSPTATAEVRLLMGVPSQIVSPQAGRPVLGIVQDALLGAHLMTLPDVLMDAGQFMAVTAAARRRGKLSLDEHLRIPPPAVVRPTKLWTGKQVVDFLLPPVTLEYGDVGSVWDAVLVQDDALVTVVTQPVIVRNGRLLSGSLSKATLGASSSSLGQQVRLTIGDEPAVGFMGDLQRVVNRYLLERGFSVGIGHCVPSSGCNLEMSEGIDRVLERIDTLQSEVPRWSSSAICKDSGRVGVELLAVESTVHRMVNNVQMSTGNLVRREMRPSNGLSAMVTAGSKGNSINICQIMLCVGQNCVNGERIGRDGADDRTLPSYAHGDRSVDGAGFVCNSYLLGLRGGESFMHAKGGREGLVDTAVKTARTGYIQRRLVKGMESHRAEHDQSVRDAANNIVELLYGGDGMNPSRMERVQLTAYPLGDRALEETCTEHELPALLSARDEVRASRLASPASSTAATQSEAWVALPVDPARIVRLVRHAEYGSGDGPVTAIQVFRDVKQLVDEVLEALPREATGPLRLALMYELRARVVADLSCAQWHEVLAQVRGSISAGLIEAGEMVGCIAAQSIGEPATQMTLNTFHLAGVAVGGRGQLSGIPRMSELLDATRNIKTSQMTLRLRDPSCEGTQTRARSLERCTLAQVVTSYTMEHDGWGLPARESDTMLVAVAAICGDMCDVPVLRLQLNRRLLRRRGATPEDVLRAARSGAPGMRGVASPDGEVEWVLRMWPTGAMTEVESAAAYSRMMRSVVIGGLAEIELCELATVRRAVVDPRTNAVVVEDERVVVTEGSALMQVMNEPWVDWERSTSNDVMDVYHTLGVEAARSVIFNELRELVAGDSGKVDDRHIMLVANTMTQYGVVMPMSRHGINRIAETGPLMRCSFEETSEVLTDAGTFAESDTLRGVSQSIMFGRTPYAGTGCCEVMREPCPKPESVRVQVDTRSGPTESGRMVRSSFRGKRPAPKPVSSTNPLFMAATTSDWEPPYMVGEEDPWPDHPSIGASCALHPEPPSPTELARDSHRIRRELVDVISRVPFAPPLSPVRRD